MNTEHQNNPTFSNAVVLKFGGTSVSTAENWKNIAAIVKARIAEGLHPIVVHSAISKMTDALEKLLSDALQGSWEAALATIIKRHRQLAADLGVSPDVELEDQFNKLRQIASGIGLVGEVSERLRARVMAQGELMATRLGAAYLASQGLNVKWIDAREALKAEARKNASTRATYLSATCNFEPDTALQSQWLNKTHDVHITQGFIASDDVGDTVLLGRGGSDTSGSYFAAKLLARRLEIWTDVPGMFSANPRSVPTARLLRALEYDEAQEIASAGAKVLHPRCIMPVKQFGIPLYVYATQTPELEGTVITAHGGDGDAHVKAVTVKKGITLVSMETVGMWHSVGFLADAFQVFKQHGMSVDLVSTSETNVTVSLDPAANALHQEALDTLVNDLAQLCRVEVYGPCAAVSLVGKSIRGILHKLGDALELFEEQKIYLVTQAANDLNLTFVVDEEQGDRLVSRLHEITIHDNPNAEILGPTWEQLYNPAPTSNTHDSAWWNHKRTELIAIANKHASAFVYDRSTLQRQVDSMKQLNVAQIFYAMKANWHADILKLFANNGLGIECVSRGELEYVFATLPDLDRRRVLFTPNFAPRTEYEYALSQGVHITIDNLYILQSWPTLFSKREVLLRVDTGYGRGHHSKVRTAGAHSKFGIPLSDFAELEQLIKQHQIRVIGLQAHTGSGVFNVDNWYEVANTLASLAAQFKDVRILDIGGGLGVPEKSHQSSFDIAALKLRLDEFKKSYPQYELWMEPGRYLVAEAGVLVATVTQCKGKGAVQYVGVTTGMNSLIRPALYGAHHEIVNLSRINEPAVQTVNVVGPICESGDQLGLDRLLPPTIEGDVLLIGTAGAYGRAMSSQYNLRNPATEVMLDS